MRILRNMNPPRIRAVASFGDDSEKIEFSLPPGAVPEMLVEAAMKPQFQLYGMSVRYSYPDETLTSRQPVPANTLVEVSLPYCLNLPNGIVIKVKTSACPPAFVALAKTWTELPMVRVLRTSMRLTASLITLQA